MNPSCTRRTLLQAAAGMGALGLAGRMSLADILPRPVRITLSGQALMTYPLCAAPYQGLEEVCELLRGGDAVFTDLEAAIRTPASGSPTRDTQFLHTAPPEVLACLKSMGFNLLALSNNHAWDLGTAGVLATRDAVAEAGFGYAGTGANLAEATAAGRTPDFQVGLVSMATGKIRDGAAATAGRPGVNELRMADGDLLEEDVLRNLEAIAVASRRHNRGVIAYLHNHQWGEDMAVTKPWARRFAQRCVDAGATVFASHGAPLLHGIEMYRGRPLLHGLGSLVFHTRTAPGHYAPEVWESAIVHCDFTSPQAVAVTLVPVVLNEIGDDPAHPLETRGRPRIAVGADRERILTRLARLSAELGTMIRYDSERAWIA